MATLDAFDRLRFEDLFEAPRIQSIQDTFSEATGVASVIVDPDGRPLTRPTNARRLCRDLIGSTDQGLAGCRAMAERLRRSSLDGPAMQPCPSGALWDGAASISLGSRHLASWMVGQVRDAASSDESVASYVREVGATPDSLGEALVEVPRVAKAQFEKVCKSLWEITRQLSSAATDRARHLTERARAEAELASSSRVLRMLSSSNQALIHAQHEASLWDQICQIAVGVGGYHMAWAGLVEHDEAQSLRPVAHAGVDSGYIASAKVSWGDNERGRGPGGTAIRSGRPSIARNIPADPAFVPWREAAAKHGYKSMIALPLVCGATTLGALGIYSVQTDAFDAAEVALLEELAGDLAYGVTALRERERRRRAEEKLVESERLHRLITENISETIAIYGLELRPTYVSPSVRSMRGFTAEEALGQRLDQVLTPESRDRALAMFATWQAAEARGEGSDGRRWSLELTECRKDGSVVDVECSLTPLRDGSGPATGFLVVTRDITERKQAAAALQRANDELEARVERRTAELSRTNEQLRTEIAERKKAEEARTAAQAERDAVQSQLREAQKLEAIGRLAAGVAHELNTPLQFVSDSVRFVHDSLDGLARLTSRWRALVDALQRGATVGPALDSLARAQEEADLGFFLEEAPASLQRSLDGLERMATIVHSLKEFAHPDHGDTTAVDLNHSVETVLALARNEYKDVADLELTLAELPRVTCYAGEINSALLNIVVNAARAIGEVVAVTGQRGRLTISTRLEGDQVLVSIGDTGGGIAPGVREHIFDPFFTTREVGQGTGQGLFIARTVVVKKHGGSLTFETEPGRGTVFHLRIPVGGPPK